jgi:hypothetical protein
MSDPEPSAPAWQRWLLAERPRLGHFLVGAASMLLPVAALGAGSEWIIPAMGVSAIIGGGLGVGWLLACGRAWLRHAVLTSVMVFAVTLGCLGHLLLMPRWETWLRAQDALAEGRRAYNLLAAGEQGRPASYDTGQGRRPFIVNPAARADANALCFYTAEPLLRWTLIGYQPSCFVVIYGDGRARLLPAGDGLPAH